jgi:hypothetical protein
MIDVPPKPKTSEITPEGGRGETPREASAPDAGKPLPSVPAVEAGLRDVTAPVPTPDASHDTLPDAGRDASPPPVADAACTGPLSAWYADDDRDGYGRSGDSTDVRFDCIQPGEKWAKVAGDCEDDDPSVHPGQTTYFGAPYEKKDGTKSFDYDCSNFEESDPAVPIAPKSCGLLSLALCDGAGYAATGRAGFGLNEYCGSGVWSTCSPTTIGLLVCQATSEARDPPYGCR